LEKIDSGKPASLQSRHDKVLVQLDNYKLLVESVEDYAIFLLDPEGYIISWNKGAERNKGYKANEIIGKHFSQFYMQQDVDAKKPERELVLAQKFGRIEDEDWRVRKDGSRFWANVIITALYNDGELVGFAKVTRDLTERKKQEDDLRKANTLLRQQREELRLLNEAKDEFISLASHQLRTPATAIKQLLGLLIEGLQGDLPEDQLVTIQKAFESNERQLSIVNSLLKVAQLDAGKVILRKETTDIGALLHDVIDEQAESISRRQQTVIYNTPDKPLIASIDQKYFRMAIENLIDNASKYTPNGGVITINPNLVDDKLTISIEDTGVGVEKEDIDKLFEKFARIQNDMSHETSGSGLGLYWVREVISLHGGKIQVTSAPKKGTTFKVLLPPGEEHA
jgi:PAS domain S-box-containing protein